MSGILHATWYQKFRGEMIALGCKFISTPSMFEDEDIEIPREKMEEAHRIIAKYSDPNRRKS